MRHDEDDYPVPSRYIKGNSVGGVGSIYGWIILIGGAIAAIAYLAT